MFSSAPATFGGVYDLRNHGRTAPRGSTVERPKQSPPAMTPCVSDEAAGALSLILAPGRGPQKHKHTETGSGRIAGSDKQAGDQSAEEADGPSGEGADVRGG